MKVSPKPALDTIDRVYPQIVSLIDVVQLNSTHIGWRPRRNGANGPNVIAGFRFGSNYGQVTGRGFTPEEAILDCKREIIRHWKWLHKEINP